VQPGDQRGRELGYPTANVAVPDELLLPADGIYAGWYVRPDGSRLPTAISLGRRPTFYESQPFSLLEAHVLDFSGDLYGEEAAVRFVARLRGEERFDSVDALVEQIGRDVARARELLLP
jgi:riboflavin kinase/FMN adenylyltransferase